MQQTLRKTVYLDGIGLHSGRTVHMRIHPAPAGQGVVFVRTDLDGDNVIPALWDRVTDTKLCTVISNAAGASVGTIEHVMAALRGCGIDNARIELDGPEVPILDGSAALFITLFDEAGVAKQSAPRRGLRVLKPVTVTGEGGKSVTLKPAALPRYMAAIEYDHPDIGRQAYDLTLVNGNFRHDVADCRTFGFVRDVEALRAAGLALGGSVHNAVVLDDNGVISPGGLRCQTEMVRHKVLDAVGDIALCGGVLVGEYDGEKAGHALNNQILRALFADESAYEWFDLYIDLQDDHPPAIPARPVAKTAGHV